MLEKLSCLIPANKFSLNFRFVYPTFYIPTWLFNIMCKRQLIFSQIFLFKVITFLFMLTIWKNPLFAISPTDSVSKIFFYLTVYLSPLHSSPNPPPSLSLSLCVPLPLPQTPFQQREHHPYYANFCKISNCFHSS